MHLAAVTSGHSDMIPAARATAAPLARIFAERGDVRLHHISISAARHVRTRAETVYHRRLNLMNKFRRDARRWTRPRRNGRAAAVGPSRPPRGDRRSAGLCKLGAGADFGATQAPAPLPVTDRAPGRFSGRIRAPAATPAALWRRRRGRLPAAAVPVAAELSQPAETHCGRNPPVAKSRRRCRRRRRYRHRRRRRRRRRRYRSGVSRLRCCCYCRRSHRYCRPAAVRSSGRRRRRWRPTSRSLLHPTRAVARLHGVAFSIRKQLESRSPRGSAARFIEVCDRLKLALAFPPPLRSISLKSMRPEAAAASASGGAAGEGVAAARCSHR